MDLSCVHMDKTIIRFLRFCIYVYNIFVRKTDKSENIGKNQLKF